MHVVVVVIVVVFLNLVETEYFHVWNININSIFISKVLFKALPIHRQFYLWQVIYFFIVHCHIYSQVDSVMLTMATNNLHVVNDIRISVFVINWLRIHVVVHVYFVGVLVVLVTVVDIARCHARKRDGAFRIRMLPSIRAGQVGNRTNDSTQAVVSSANACRAAQRIIDCRRGDLFTVTAALIGSPLWQQGLADEYVFKFDAQRPSLTQPLIALVSNLPLQKLSQLLSKVKVDEVHLYCVVEGLVLWVPIESAPGRKTVCADVKMLQLNALFSC